MTEVRRPWFALYVDHFEADERVRLLSNQAVGCYIKLLCVQWREGSIPRDTGKLARLVGAEPAAFASLWKGGLSDCFKPKGDGRLVNQRLEAERLRAAEVSQRLAEGGRRGGKRRRKRADAAQLEALAGSAESHPSERRNGKAAAVLAFASAWADYPKRAGSNPRKDAEAQFVARVAEGVPPDTLVAGLGRYHRFCLETNKIGTEYVMQGRRFFGKARPFDEPWDLPAGAAKTAGPSKPSSTKPPPFRTA